ncbi:hypothetical protein [Herbiconiux sp. L3-i23]|uniref:hypothetical protein n=1 Tax=Herbiconiux sp. L3-i23 TaxID=2905871 RepID=UPI00206639DC|nr:hypothetical protein [Herbiconiux sp. L3-i23]BDI21520.1 hypothetical protein L3i23_02960 [Herbiconiux sp. L3-i23]
MSIEEREPAPTPASRAFTDDSFLVPPLTDDRPRELALMWTATATAVTALSAALLATLLPL